LLKAAVAGRRLDGLRAAGLRLVHGGQRLECADLRTSACSFSLLFAEAVVVNGQKGRPSQ